MITTKNSYELLKGLFGVYKITSPSERHYVGSGNLYDRYNHYKRLSCKNQIKIYNSIMKYGWEAHTFEVLCIDEIENLYCLENHFGLLYDVLGSGLNCMLPNCGDIKKIVGEETRDRMRQSQLGRKHPLETKLKIAKTLTGKKYSQERIEKSANSRRGQKRSSEQIETLILAHSKKVIDIETGVIYSSIKQASLENNIGGGHLSRMLRGIYTNKTNLRYF